MNRFVSKARKATQIMANGRSFTRPTADQYRDTVHNVDTLRRFLRMHGDSPDFFLWYKEFLMPETEKHIYLETTHRNPLSDDELAARLKQRFDILKMQRPK
ncbi:MAG: hypothetical protein K0Q73_1248 [Paenibacillus sp.]|jgi:hypothetical protein|nr:hypothetical protein [Paenibacillus sp.]